MSGRNKDDEYRREAANAQNAADHASNDRDRSAWLRIAQGWLLLIRNRTRRENSFNAELKSRGTGQTNSDRSH